jgi:ABC-2 type transport system permease protein
MLVAPVPRICLPAGKALGAVVVITLQSAAILALGPLLGLPLTVTSYALAVACCAVTASVFSMLGLYLAMAIRRVETLQAAIQLAMYPLLFLSGSVFSIESAPAWLQALTAMNPMTYAVELVRMVVLAPLDAQASGSVLLDIVVLATLLLLATVGVWRRVGR